MYLAPCVDWLDAGQFEAHCSVQINNNEYLERLTRTSPKRLHVLYKYILPKFSAYNINAHTHTHTHAHTDSHRFGA